MSKYLQIQIPKPCHENWHAMDAAKQGKFCNACQKTVIDFTLMSDNELAAFFKKSEGNVCGRFANDQLNTDLLIPSKKIPWVKYFFQIAIPAFLFTSKTVAQGSVKAVQKHVVDKKRVKSQIPAESMNYNLNTTTCKNVALQNDASQVLQGSVGGVAITVGGATAGVRIKQRKSFSIPLFTRNSFTVFPNPVASNSTLNIKWKEAVNNEQTIEIYNQTGGLLQQEVLRINIKSYQESISLKFLPIGNYTIRITDSKTHKSQSQQFIVQ